MSSSAARPTDHRQRILQAMAEVLVSKRYIDATVADVATQAHMSKRTFYEHFANKEACLLALCEYTSDQIMWVILQVYSPDKPWRQLVHDITQAYLSVIQASPALMHALYVELFATGRPGLTMRLGVGQRFADFLCSQVDIQRSQGEALKVLDRRVAMAVVAGINELILQAIMDGRGSTLMDLADTAETLVHAVTQTA